MAKIVIMLDFLNIEKIVIIAFTCALLFDWITGLWKGHKMKNIKSRLSIDGIVNKTLLLFLPLVLALFFKAFGIEIGISVKVIFAMLTISEIFSSVGNIYTARTGVELPEYDAVTAILKMIHQNIVKFFRTKTNDTNDK